MVLLPVAVVTCSVNHVTCTSGDDSCGGRLQTRLMAWYMYIDDSCGGRLQTRLMAWYMYIDDSCGGRLQTRLMA